MTESNKTLFQSRTSLFQKVIFPFLDDQSLLRFGSTCKTASKLVSHCRLPWKVFLVSNDGHGKAHRASKALINLSDLIKSLQTDNPSQETLSIYLKCTTLTLLTIIEYSHAPSDFDVNKFNVNVLLDLAQAADTLKIGCLLDLISQKIVSLIQDKKVQEIRTSFDLIDDFSKGGERSWQRHHDFRDDEEESVLPIAPELTIEDLLAPLPEKRRQTLSKRLAFLGRNWSWDDEDGAKTSSS